MLKRFFYSSVLVFMLWLTHLYRCKIPLLTILCLIWMTFLLKLSNLWLIVMHYSMFIFVTVSIYVFYLANLIKLNALWNWSMYLTTLVCGRVEVPYPLCLNKRNFSRIYWTVRLNFCKNKLNLWMLVWVLRVRFQRYFSMIFCLFLRGTFADKYIRQISIRQKWWLTFHTLVVRNFASQGKKILT